MTDPHGPAPDIYDPAYVKDVFDRCSGRYIAFSYACSFGFTERWRRQCVAALPVPRSGLNLGYDLMAGTGEAWPHLLKRFPNLGAITAIDISTGMHEHAMARLHQHRAHKIAFIEDNIFDSQLPEQSADFLVSTFGLKTFNTSQQTDLARLVARVLKPGGTFSFIEASDPSGWAFRPLYRFHMTGVLPMVERLFLQGAQDFTMIGQYTANFGNARNFAAELEAAGLQTDYHEYFFGCASGVSGRKLV
ncbi:MAG: class I SAM-dependent methyltransferase [Hyphomonas sp.]|jgi:demethylmenaquinone methyltransferase/2-methoxy-6-polyprenyl-1,4-benzoquinol methylase|uniref:class I SAM-dependent methyltransferase n=1 Tax=unclassified Hyphomonas TaxID=2630699 RepID=UPI000C5961AA|nr:MULTISPECIES: class I SAM-dependent methyltransferase [unclassified Hyphomonas]MAA81718.1 ubiquinone biosynthesis methyltransferase UbiE [Hyphomonas sp.]MBG67915.1 ubiquinone biosynthesis methyltransferase UbiE [Hyphomonas sp.]MBO6581683.1 class I SAM-dependent methyltransferase [Hyphomonas sp.]QSR23415.1 ubiquinone biosynthesis methyltransferase UbiE [Hyphomonas sp. KY3]|tara:strand:- start:10477 stop:11217 length:741 start_codon:yes stop_codon:yes gene_type:complete